MHCAGCYSANKIEGEVFPVSKSVLNVVTEYVKVQHISRQVEQAAVHEHRGENSMEPLSRYYVGWNHSIVEYGIPECLRSLKREKEKDDYIDYYEDPSDVRSGQRTIFVSKGNQASPPRAWFLTSEPALLVRRSGIKSCHNSSSSTEKFLLNLTDT